MNIKKKVHKWQKRMFQPIIQYSIIIYMKYKQCVRTISISTVDECVLEKNILSVLFKANTPYMINQTSKNITAMEHCRERRRNNKI